MATKKKSTESRALKKILDEVHEDKPDYGFVDRFAEHFSLENMGQDPTVTRFHDMFCEAEGAECMTEEKRGWVKVARAIRDVLVKRQQPLTIRNAIVEFEAHSKKYSKMYA
jgi:hypothetical protein